ncbi:MAG: L,D-transpeptidase family protein [Candidatus Omnitrophota bacterium]
MKKNSFLIILVLATFFMPAITFATEADVKNATDRTPATLKMSSQTAPAKELPKTDQDALKKDTPITNEIKTTPIATVSNTKKGSGVASDIKAETSASKASTEVLAGKVAEAPVKKETSSALNPAEMQQRWKALFSKEMTPDSIAYTVKSGDSLYMIAKKNHTTVDFIKKINDLKSDNIYPKMKLRIHTAPFLIRIDKSKNVLVLYSNDEAVKKYSVATGKKNCTPVGEFKITDKLVHPTWFKTGAILPPGSPENALGTRWLGFDKPAYGIHGTIEPKSIGTQVSEGCIRMLNEDVEELYSIVPIGTKVIIQD